MKTGKLTPWRWGKNDWLAMRDSSDPFSLFHDEVNSLFKSFTKAFDSDWNGLTRRYGNAPSGIDISPRLDVVETDTEFKITAELPGMDEKDVELQISNDRLTIKGEKKIEKEDKNGDYYRMERAYGTFCRVIPLPESADTEKVEASFGKGVLKIVVPKSKEAESELRRIEIRKE